MYLAGLPESMAIDKGFRYVIFLDKIALKVSYNAPVIKTISNLVLECMFIIFAVN